MEKPNLTEIATATPAPGHGAISRTKLYLAASFAGLLFTLLSAPAFAGSDGGATSASASIHFRIVIPAIIRVTPVAQPEHLVLEERHIAQGYIDLDAGTSVKLTNNTRGGYLLSASFNLQLLSSVEVRVADQQLNATAGFGSMRVASGLAVEKLVAISYRFHLAPGTRAGEYGWPVALGFALANA